MGYRLSHKSFANLLRLIFSHFPTLLLGISITFVFYIQYFLTAHNVGTRGGKPMSLRIDKNVTVLLKTDVLSTGDKVCGNSYQPSALDNVSYTPYKYIPLPFRKEGAGPYVNILDVPSPSYLDNYKSFCWREELVTATPYKKQSGQRTALEEEWQRRLAAGMSWRMRCLPYFYIAGFPKCGTSDLFHHINLHPLVANISRKEVHYWTKRRVEMKKDKLVSQHICLYVDVFDKAALDVDACRVKTENTADEYHPMVIGEASPSTLWWTDFWQQLPENNASTTDTGPSFHPGHYIRHVTPKAKFIVLMRNPADVAYSWYLFKGGRDLDHFHNLTVQAIERLQTCLQRRTMRSCVNDLSLQENPLARPRVTLYIAWVSEWLKVFPRDQFFFATLEEYSMDRVKVINDICDFLEIGHLPDEVKDIREAAVSNSMTRSSVYEKVGPLPKHTRAFIQDFYKPYNKGLAKLLKDDKFNFIA